MWIHEMFGVQKPIIALLHLDALPGDPGYCGSLNEVLDHAYADLTALQNGDVRLTPAWQIGSGGESWLLSALTGQLVTPA